MSQGLGYIHSHSALERELRFEKENVLVDACFASELIGMGVRVSPFKYNGVSYIKVPILAFVRAGGVFKNLYT